MKKKAIFLLCSCLAQNHKRERRCDKQSNMVRFSLGRDFDDGDDWSGPSSSCRPNPKRRKSCTANASSLTPSPPEPPVVQHIRQGLIDETEEEVSEEESEYEGEGEPVDSGCEEEEDGEDEDGDEELEDQIDGENGETVGDGSISVTLTDPDVLDCPICLEPLTIPVFQCENGHVACTSCCSKIHNRCPSCSFPIGYNRCRAVEKIFESIKICCRNVKYGCKEMVKYSDKSNHENSCTFAPCSCPILECNYVNSSWRLFAHFGTKHTISAKGFALNRLFSVCLDRNQKFLILRDNSEGRLFIVNNHLGENLASAVSIICIGPTSLKKKFLYEISVRDGEMTTIKLQSVVESIPAWIDGPPAKNFLLVPNHCKNSLQQLKLEVCISEPSGGISINCLFDE